jgi:hypothetical protein
MNQGSDEQEDSTSDTSSPVGLDESQRVVELGRKLLARFDRYGLKGDPQTNKAFDKFVDALYSAKLVMKDF